MQRNENNPDQSDKVGSETTQSEQDPDLSETETTCMDMQGSLDKVSHESQTYWCFEMTVEMVDVSGQ